MATKEAGLFKAYGGDSCEHPTDGSINDGGCTEKRETRSRIGPDVVTPTVVGKQTTTIKRKD